MVPFPATPETKFFRGKPAPGTEFSQVKLDKNGKVYGYETLTGRLQLPFQCSYCDFKQTGGCWPNAVMEVKDGKPVWIT